MLHLTAMSIVCFSLRWVFSLCGTLMTSSLLKITGHFWGKDPSAGVFLLSPLDWAWSWVFGRNNTDRASGVVFGWWCSFQSPKLSAETLHWKVTLLVFCNWQVFSVEYSCWKMILLHFWHLWGALLCFVLACLSALLGTGNASSRVQGSFDSLTRVIKIMFH